MITVSFGWWIVPKIKNIAAFGDKKMMVKEIKLPFISMMFWGENATNLLVKTMWGQLKEWPSVRIQHRKGYAKGRAQGLEESRGKIEYWRDAYQERTDELSKCQVEKNNCLYALNALRYLDKKNNPLEGDET